MGLNTDPEAVEGAEINKASVHLGGAKYGEGTAITLQVGDAFVDVYQYSETLIIDQAGIEYTLFLSSHECRRA